MRWMLVWSLAFGLIIAGQTAQSRVIGKHSEFVASVPDGFSCADSVTVNIRAASRNAFVEKAPDLAKVVGLVRVVIGFECPQVKEITFDGYHGNRKVTTATVAAASNWRLAGFTDVPDGGQVSKRPTPPAGSMRGAPRVVASTQPNAAPNDGGNDAEYERAVERVLGFELVLTRFPKRSKIGKSIPVNPIYVFEKVKSGSGIRKGNILTHLNGALVKGPSDLRRLTIGFICKKTDKLDFGMLWPMPLSYPRRADWTMSARYATSEPPKNICGVVAKAPAKQFRNFGPFNGYVDFSIDGATAIFHIRPHTQKEYSDRPGFLRKIRSEIRGTELHKHCRKGCVIHLHRLSGAGVVGKYKMIPYPFGPTLISELGKSPYGRIAREYTYDALGFLSNLSANNLGLIRLTNSYHTAIARLYYWFGLNYGKYCQAHIKKLGSVKLKITKTRNYGWGGSQIINQDETVYPVEKSFVARTIDYGNWYIHGLAEIRVNKGMSKFINEYGCTSTAVSNVRKNLLRFGLSHKKIRSEKGF